MAQENTHRKYPSTTRYTVTRTYSWSITVEAESSEQADQIADMIEVDPKDIIEHGYLYTDIESHE